MAENLDTARFSAIFISAIEMGHENTKNLKSIYKTEDFRNLNPYMPTPWDWHHYVWQSSSIWHGVQFFNVR